MPAYWKTVRVFISSTFKDMQAERDHLVRFVFPLLRQELLKRRIHFVDVDLRWGVTSEQDALEVCREIVDECRPRFLCMLGGRYGWTPEGESRSITEDEIRYATLESQDDGYHFFYFRDPAATSAIIEAVPGEYRELPGSDEEEQLARLKREVIDAGLNPFVYPADWDDEQRRFVGLEAFGDRVFQELFQSIEDEFGSHTAATVDELSAEDLAIEAFIAERVERYVVGSRQPVFEDLFTFTEANGTPNILVLSGVSGSGKSALLGKFYLDLTEQNESALVIPHFVGASTGSTDLRRTLRRLCRQLAETDSDRQEISTDVRSLIGEFASRLEHAAETRRVVLIIDALNQMDAADNAHLLQWLPQEFPDNVRVIVSSLEHATLDALRERGELIREVALRSLSAVDAEAIVRGVLHRYRKQFDREQLQLLLRKPAAGIPLYLLVALEELRTLGSYEEITGRVRELPGSVQELFQWILTTRLSCDPGFRDKEGHLIGADLVRRFVSYLGVSRHGLSESELAGLIAPGSRDTDPSLRDDDRQGNVAALRRLLSPYLMNRGELLDFYHGQLREAVESAYLSRDEVVAETHRELASYFDGLLNPSGAARWSGESVRALSELPFHQTRARDWTSLTATLCDLKFIKAKCTSKMTYELVEDFERMTDQLQPVPESLSEFGGFVRNEVSTLARFPELTLQHAANVSGQSLVKSAARALLDGRQLGEPWLEWINRPTRSKSLLMTIAAHSEEIADCAVSPDGNRIASVSHDRSIRIWEAATGRPLLTIQPDEVPVTCAFSPDGRRLVSASKHQPSSEVCQWDARTGQLLTREKDEVPSTVQSRQVVFHANGRQFVTSSGGFSGYTGEGYLTFWSTASGQPVEKFRSTQFVSIASTGDKIVACKDGNPMLLDFPRLEQCGGISIRQRGHRYETCLAIPGRKEIVVIVWAKSKDTDGVKTRRQTIEVRDAESLDVLRQMTIDRSLNSRSVSLSSDGRLLVGSSLGSVHVYDLVAQRQVAQLGLHGDSVSRCRFSPDGTRLVCSAQDGTIKVWDLNTAMADAEPGEWLGVVTDCAFSPDGTTFATTTALDDSLKIWNGETGTLIHEQLVPEPQSCAYSPDGRSIIIGHSRSELRQKRAGRRLSVYDVHERMWRRRFRRRRIPPVGRIAQIAIFMTGVLTGAAVIGLLGAAFGWLFLEPGMAKWGFLVPFVALAAFLLFAAALGFLTWRTQACAVSPDGDTCIAAGDDGMLRCWSLKTGRPVRGPWGCISPWLLVSWDKAGLGRYKPFFKRFLGLISCEFSCDGRLILSGFRDTDATEVDEPRTGSGDAASEGHAESPSVFEIDLEAALLPDSQRSEIVLWDARRRTRVARLCTRKCASNVCSFSPGSDRIVGASSKKEMTVWQTETLNPLTRLVGHSGLVTACRFSPDGRLIASASDDGTVRIWNSQNGRQLLVFPENAQFSSLAWRSDGQCLVACGDKGRVCLLSIQNLDNVRE